MRFYIPLGLAAATLTATMATTPALAQQDTERAPFTGPRVEFNLGYDHVGGNNGTDSKDGLEYGGALGYDAQVGGVILGIEGEVAGSTAKQYEYNIAVAGDSLRVKADRDLYIGGRVGYAIAPTTLLYVKGGYTNQRVNIDYADGTGSGFRDHVTLDGWRAGAGVEQKFSRLPGGYVKLEYRYSNYNNANYGNFNQDIDLDRHQVVAGVGVRF